MVATHDYKLAVNREEEPYLLYDLRADPLQTGKWRTVETAR
jgi:hypothetical protein